MGNTLFLKCAHENFRSCSKVASEFYGELGTERCYGLGSWKSDAVFWRVQSVTMQPSTFNFKFFVSLFFLFWLYFVSCLILLNHGLHFTFGVFYRLGLVCQPSYCTSGLADWLWCCCGNCCLVNSFILPLLVAVELINDWGADRVVTLLQDIVHCDAEVLHESCLFTVVFTLKAKQHGASV